MYILHASDGKILLDRAANWLYVCHPQRDSQQTYTRTWESNFTGKLPLTRFLDKPAKQAFQPQKAAFFESPAVPEPPEATTAAGASNAGPKQPAKKRTKAARGTRR